MTRLRNKVNRQRRAMSWKYNQETCKLCLNKLRINIFSCRLALSDGLRFTKLPCCGARVHVWCKERCEEHLFTCPVCLRKDGRVLSLHLDWGWPGDYDATDSLFRAIAQNADNKLRKVARARRLPSPLAVTERLRKLPLPELPGSLEHNRTLERASASSEFHMEPITNVPAWGSVVNVTISRVGDLEYSYQQDRENVSKAAKDAAVKIDDLRALMGNDLRYLLNTKKIEELRECWRKTYVPY